MIAHSSPLDAAALEDVLRPLASARPLPRSAYIDEAAFAFEQHAIFRRSWICVAHADDVALPGQWVFEHVGGEPILVVRGADLELRAFYDVCRHRGASIVGGAARAEGCGRSTRFECPYHGWTYELDGRLRVVPFAPPGLDRTTNALRGARVEQWAGFVFVCLDPDATALREMSAPPWLRSPMSLRRGRRVTYDVHANWKLCVENFQESHHFTRVHHGLEHVTPTSDARTWMPAAGGPWLGGTMDMVAGAETVSLDSKRHDRPLVGDDEAAIAIDDAMLSRARTVFDAMLFPSLLTSLQPDYFLTYRLVPRSVDSTRVIADIYFHPAAFVEGFDPRDVYDFWDRVNEEDRAICEDQQRNASSVAFEPACYVTVEEGMHAFDRLVARAHLQQRR